MDRKVNTDFEIIAFDKESVTEESILLLLVGVGVFFGFSSNFLSGSFPWILIAIVGGIIVLLSLGISIVFQRRKPSDTYDISLNENLKSFEESIQRREDDDFVPLKKMSSRYNYDTKYCKYADLSLRQEQSSA